MNDLQRLARHKARMIAVIVAMITIVLLLISVGAMQDRVAKSFSDWGARDEKIYQAVELK